MNSHQRTLQGRHQIIHGSSQWMPEMAFVIRINEEQIVLRVNIESTTPTDGAVVRMFLGRVIADSSHYPGISVYGSYDLRFSQPNWLVLEQH
jgi:hypothetical protein